MFRGFLERAGLVSPSAPAQPAYQHPARVPTQQTWVLNEAKSVVLDSIGNGIVKIGPAKASERWRVRTVAVSTSTAVKVPVASVYTGFLAPGNLLGGTYTGSNDSDDVDVTLGPGSFLTVAWQGGDAGATATVSVYGDRLVKTL